MAALVAQVALEPVISLDDVEDLTHINERALDGDPLKGWMRLFTERTESESTRAAVTSALEDPEYRIVKATIQDPDNPSHRRIVGFVHWFTGYIVLDKVDPFAGSREAASVIKDSASTHAKDHENSSKAVNAGSLADAAGKRARRLKRGEAKYVETRNHYIARIRGKRHSFIRRIMVLPAFQGRGIGTKLLEVVTRDADQQRIASWLFARPAGVKLYEQLGFVTVGTTRMDEPEEDFTCPPTYSMIRAPIG